MRSSRKPCWQRLKASFDPWWAFPKLTPAQIDIFRSIIHPEVVIRAISPSQPIPDGLVRNSRRAAPESRPVRYQSPMCSRVQSSRSISTVPRSTASELASARGYLRRIFSIALPLASSSMSLSR